MSNQALTKAQLAAIQSLQMASAYNQAMGNAQGALNQAQQHALGQYGMGVGGHTGPYPPLVARWQDKLTWAQLRNKDPELAAFVEATANLLDCEIDAAMSPMNYPVSTYLGGRVSRIRYTQMIWAIRHVKFGLTVQWMQQGPPIDESMWREKFREMAAIIEDEREYQKEHPDQAAMNPMPPPPTYQQAVRVGQIAGTVSVAPPHSLQAHVGSGVAQSAGGLLGMVAGWF
jgi:hypothetical protein